MKIKQAIEAIKQGKMIIVTDNEDRENEGDLVMAAEWVTPSKINFMVTEARGLVCLSMSPILIDRLALPMMTVRNTSQFNTPFTVSIEAASGVTTGISAFDRAHTIQTVIADKVQPSDVVVPGHVFPLRSHPKGVLGRAGHTEAAVDFVRLAGLKPAGVICEIMNPDGTMARRPELEVYAKKHGLLMVSIEELIAYRREHDLPKNEIVPDTLIEEVAKARLPVADLGEFQIRVFREKAAGLEHVMIQKGEVNTDVLVRLHSQCLTGDIFGSVRCDCGGQLHVALEKIASEGGILLYLTQEGRGIGLANKIKAYALQDQGLDTVEANHCLGFADDLRQYDVAGQILKQVGAKSIRLLTNNPRKIAELEQEGLIVTREALEMLPHPENESYLTVKRKKLGHLLGLVG